MGSMPGERSMFCSLVLWEIQAMWNESLGKPLLHIHYLLSQSAPNSASASDKFQPLSISSFTPTFSL